MEKSLDRIRQFANNQLKPSTEISNLLAAIESASLTAVSRVGACIVIDSIEYRFANNSAAMRFCDLLREYFKDRLPPIEISCDDRSDTAKPEVV